MSKAFISKVLQQSTEVTGAAANRATNDLIDFHRQGNEEVREVHPPQLRHVHGSQDQGTQGA